MTDIKPGDRVRIVSEYVTEPGRYAGQYGTVCRVDGDDLTFPYGVLLDGEEGCEWFHSVELVEPGPADLTRADLVVKAKELLAGTPHTAADIIAMARFLAGE
ncbi:hypothetical protein NPS70_16270 [Streptomyces sp. C10-9-1]|uniref:hypothetical protein n=1 Tax=Streptomyces sp. C10-9-1 TaxID=1859285 RepID=UPI00211256DF|nr:hypothetical protein [Streptomyces sp. C10-9-1]MCQ6554741.1 hypothetical protein [Streptomyces sp. C10-9-1]